MPCDRPAPHAELPHGPYAPCHLHDPHGSLHEGVSDDGEWVVCWHDNPPDAVNIEVFVARVGSLVTLPPPTDLGERLIYSDRIHPDAADHHGLVDLRALVDGGPVDFSVTLTDVTDF